MLWDRLYRLKQSGVTLVLTTHYMDEAEQLCDRLVVMDKARIVAEGSPRRAHRASTPAARWSSCASRSTSRTPRSPALEGIADADRAPARPGARSTSTTATRRAAVVHDRGLVPETVLVRRSTLEDVFLRLTGRTLVD